jgi:holo-[acyl-carrier protein] synthase
LIFGIGTDLIETSRIAKAVQNQKFLSRVFSQTELEYCHKKTQAQCLAARFAAKEAFMKALGTGWTAGVSFSEIQLVNNEKGKPTLQVSGKTEKILTKLGIKSIHVSVSHIKEYALAYVILEK